MNAENNNVPIISITGTKGKTTVTAIIDDVLRKLGNNVLKVDTTGHFVNGKRKSSLEDSKEIWRLVPTVCPGRYLWEFFDNPNLKKDGVAVLECALGCSGSSGLGYRYHNVGVFLNVFEDHIGSSDRIQSRDDIVKAKSFIFSRIANSSDSYIVYNADDSFVVGGLRALSADCDKLIQKIPVGLSFSEVDLEDHLISGGVAISINENKEVVLRRSIGDEVLLDLKAIPWTFHGSFLPSVWNIVSAVGALYGFFGGNLPPEFREAIESVRLDRYGGRLTILENSSGVRVVADYAHEKVSLCSIGRLARTMAGGAGKVIGVVRLAYDRTDELLIETGKMIATEFDDFIVYDKIDGYFRKAVDRPGRFKQVNGRTSQILFDAIKSVNPNVIRIVREDEAIKHAAEIAEPGDVVVVIVNDDIKRSIDFIRDAFGAEFV